MKIEKLIDFPEARQSTNFSCGAASAQTILYFYGIELREDKIISEIPVYPINEEKPAPYIKFDRREHSGAPPKKIVSFLRSKGLKAVMAKDMTLEQLKKKIDQEVPVVVAMQAWNKKNYGPGTTPKPHLYDKTYNDGHYVVAIGYGTSSKGEPAIIFEDPSILTNRAWLPEDEFLARWHDKDSAGNVYNQLGIFVTGSPKKFQHKTMKKIL